jgi:hypothetical protein
MNVNVHFRTTGLQIPTAKKPQTAEPSSEAAVALIPLTVPEVRKLLWQWVGRSGEDTIKWWPGPATIGGAGSERIYNCNTSLGEALSP